MDTKKIAPLKLNKTAFAIAGVLVMFTIMFVCWRFYPVFVVPQGIESFGFRSGPTCFVVIESKLVVFLGDGEGEIFDNINSRAFAGGEPRMLDFFGRASGRSTNNNEEIYSYTSQFGKMTMRFFDGKSKMVLSSFGTKLTLSDGRQFTLDGKTPLWLRLMSDGTVIELDELPEGFVEYFETHHASGTTMIRSYPNAFRRL